MCYGCGGSFGAGSRVLAVPWPEPGSHCGSIMGTTSVAYFP